MWQDALGPFPRKPSEEEGGRAAGCSWDSQGTGGGPCSWPCGFSPQVSLWVKGGGGLGRRDSRKLCGLCLTSVQSLPGHCPASSLAPAIPHSRGPSLAGPCPCGSSDADRSRLCSRSPRRTLLLALSLLGAPSFSPIPHPRSPPGGQGSLALSQQWRTPVCPRLQSCS